MKAQRFFQSVPGERTPSSRRNCVDSKALVRVTTMMSVSKCSINAPTSFKRQAAMAFGKKMSVSSTRLRRVFAIALDSRSRAARVHAWMASR